jgi:aryl-alcohol dehydrogenase-like predicted oxidoreductase
MEMRPIGNAGLKASVVGLGCNNFGMKIDLESTRAVLHTCLDAGINFFDTADMYGGGKSEEFIGEVLSPRRNEIVLATKFGGVAYMSKKWRALGRTRVHQQLHRCQPQTPAHGSY